MITVKYTYNGFEQTAFLPAVPPIGTELYIGVGSVEITNVIFSINSPVVALELKKKR